MANGQPSYKGPGRKIEAQSEQSHAGQKKASKKKRERQAAKQAAKKNE